MAKAFCYSEENIHKKDQPGAKFDYSFRMLCFRNLVPFFIVLILNTATAVKLEGEDIFKCENHDSVDSGVSFGANLHEWKEDTVLTFSARFKDAKLQHQDDQLMLLLTNRNESSNHEPFNCEIDRDYKGCPAGQTNGQCCYKYLKPLMFKNAESSSDCDPSAHCRSGPEIKPCRAKCISQMTLQIKFGLSVPPSGGPITLNAVFQKSSFLQSKEVLNGEYFLIPDREEELQSKVLHKSSGGSPLNPNVPFGIWVRYSKDDTLLEIGIDGRNLPELNVNLGNVTLGPNDSAGWLGAEVANRTDIFIPKFFGFEFLSGQNEKSSGGLVVGYNCRTVIYDGFDQEQVDC